MDCKEIDLWIYLKRKTSVINHVLASCTKFLVAFDHLVNSFDQIFLGYRFPSVADSEHACLGAHWTQLSSSCVGTQTAQQLVTNALLHWHRLRVDLEDVHSALEVRQSELNLSVDSSRSHQSWIQGIWSVGSHKHLNVPSWLETVHLVDNLKHSPLHFVVSSRSIVESGAPNRIDLIKKDDAGFLGSCHLEDLSDHSCTLSHVLLHKLRANHSDEAGVSSVGYCSGSERLACAWRSI